MPADDRIDGYAAAILEVARAEEQLERVGDELFRIARAFEASNPLREALTDPRIPVERKMGVIDDLLGTKTSPLTVHLAGLVSTAANTHFQTKTKMIAKAMSPARSSELAGSNRSIPLGSVVGSSVT